MAVKVLNIPSDSENKRAIIEDLQREIDVMKTLNHPNIVRYLGAEVDSSRNILNIFQEWIPGGSVSSLLKKFGPFSVDIVKTYIQQVLTGLDYLHSHGIIHRDIKVRRRERDCFSSSISTQVAHKYSSFTTPLILGWEYSSQ